MCTLLSKELRSIFNSISGILFSVIFLIVCGSLLWLIPGNYNIAESGYASLSSFFVLAPVLLLVLIPALAMRTFSEEKKQGTLSLLLTRPVSLFDIVFSKYLAVFISVVIVLLPTFIYIVFLSYNALPQGNIDWGAIAGSYLGLLFLVSAFVAASVFASSLTSNQVVAFIVGLLICVVFYFGFDLFSGLFSSGKAHYVVRNIGFLSHYQSIQKGVIDISDIIYFFAVSCLFLVFTNFKISFLTSFGNSVRPVPMTPPPTPSKGGQRVIWLMPNAVSSAARNLPSNYQHFFASILILAALLIASSFLKFRFDLTSDKRYTLSEPVKTVLKKLQSPVTVEFYLTGDLNPGFYQLQKAALDMLNEFSNLSPGNISYRIINPYLESDKEFIKTLQEKGIKGIAVNERNREGKMVQQVVFPHLLFISGENEIPVSLLVNEPGKSGEENLNASIGMLEYRLAQALETVARKEAHKIVFLQGHGELTPDQLSDLFDLLSYNYQIDLGTLPKNPEANILNDYKLVVIPGPQEPFSEAEKYILDQYIMHGGKVMWIINGVKLDLQALAEAGATPSMANEVNLDDLLFIYGFRINPVLLKDVQCLEIPLDTNLEDADDSFTSAFWFFAPVLNATQGHVINKGISLVKTAYASTLSFVGKEAENPARNQVLLHSSELSTVVQVPEMISLHEINRVPDSKFFNQKHLPVGALIEGDFTSGYKNRPVPGNVIQGNQAFKDSIGYNKMIVLASEDIIRNDITQTESGIKIWPLGYDRFMEIQFDNREFMFNAVSYLTDSSGISALRNKHLQLRLLDKIKLSKNPTASILINILLPPLLLLVLFVINYLLRKRKYSRY